MRLIAWIAATVVDNEMEDDVVDEQTAVAAATMRPATFD